MFHALEKNAGCSIDYFLVSKELEGKMKDAGILKEVMGSDHAPVYIDINL